VEITEQSLIRDFAVSERNLGALKALGCRIAIDDFGTGYSSLSYIGRLPVHVLKLDRQFISGLSDDPSSQAIVGLTQDLARRLGSKSSLKALKPPSSRQCWNVSDAGMRKAIDLGGR